MLINILQVLPTEKENLKYECKDKSFSSPEGLQLYEKETPRHFPVHIPKVLGAAFFNRATLVGAFAVRFSIRKKFCKNLACFMCKYKSLQADQLPQKYVFLAKFIVTKYLKQEVDDNLSVWVDEHSPCGLSKTQDINMFGVM